MSEYSDILLQHQKAERIWKYDRHSRLLLRKKKEIIGADTETTGLLFHTPSILHDDNDRIVDNPFPFGLTLCFPHKDRLILVWGRYGTDLYKACQDVFASDCMKVWHNSKYDLRVCKTNDIEVNGTQLCTLTMSRIYYDRRKSHSLQALSEFVCPGISDWEDDLKKELTKLRRQWSKKKEEWNHAWKGDNKEYVNYSFLPNKMIGGYSMTDAFMVWQLFQKLSPYMCSEEYADIFDREMAVTHVVTKIEEAGMGFDAGRGRSELKNLLPKIKIKRRILDELSLPGFTLGPKKILEALKFLGVKSKQLKEKGKETTSVDVLNQAVRDGVPKRAERFIKVLLDYRAYSKIANTYLKPLTEQAERTGGTVYTTINPTDSRTGRPACLDESTKIRTICGIKQIKDIEIGDVVTTSIGTHEKVLHKWHNGIRPVFEITLDSNHIIMCTDSHRFLQYDDKWITVEEILNECIKKLDITNSKSKHCNRTIQTIKLPYNRRNSKIALYYISKCALYFEQLLTKKRVQSIEMGTPLARKERHKQPKLRKMWRATSQLQRYLQRWSWIFNNSSRRKKTFSSSCDYDRETWFETNSKRMGGSSYRWKSEEQRYKQSCSLYNQRTSNYTLLATEGQSFSAIKKIEFIGSRSVYDLMIDNDPSYLLDCGVFSHNSRSPNLLNVPNQDVKQRGRENHVRDCFVPRDGKAVYYFDVSQQEMAMFLSYAGADDMLQAYLDGADLHQHMADLLGRPGKRKIIKNQNFGVIYGLGIGAMAAKNNTTIKQAEEEMKIYNGEFPFIGELQQKLKDELDFYGHVQDYFGRKYHVPHGQAYKAVNAIVQGGCAQAYKAGLLQVDELLESKYKDAKIILPVYDEIQQERTIQDDEQEYCESIAKALGEIPLLMKLGLKFRVDIERTITNWAEKQPLTWCPKCGIGVQITKVQKKGEEEIRCSKCKHVWRI